MLAQIPRKRPFAGLFSTASNRRSSLFVPRNESRNLATPPTSAQGEQPRSKTMPSDSPPPPPTKANLKTWWHSFNFAQKVKKEAEANRGTSALPLPMIVNQTKLLLFSGRGTHTHSLWKALEGESQICERSDIHSKRERRLVCLGVYPRRRC